MGKPPGAGRGGNDRSAKNERDDEVKFEKNGTIRIWENGRSHHLGRPTVRQLREYSEAWASLASDQKADQAKAAETADDDEPFEYDDEVYRSRWFDWWRLVIEGDGEKIAPLDKLRTPLPDDNDDLRDWLLSPELVTECFTAWRSVPWEGGTSPKDAREAAQLEQANRAAPMLTAAGPLLTSLLPAAGAAPTLSENVSG